MMKWLYITISVCLFHIVRCATNPGPVTENALTQEYLAKLKESRYNAAVMPDGNNGHGSPVDVLCSMYILDVSKVDDKNMDYRAQFYFRQSWNDTRLSYLDQDINQITLSDSSQIWTPDVFFVQEKEGIHHQIITPNTFIRITPEGEVKFSVRLSMTFSCHMDFTKYPHDTQKCVFTAESYGHTKDKVELNWDRRKFPPVSANPNITLLPFELKSIREDMKSEKVSTGTYKILEIEMVFQRKTGFFISRLFVPFIFLVVLSWLSFWIPAKMIALRLSYLLVILYLMVTIGYGINDYIPPASYTKGSDVWIAVCESLVFAAFLEFIAVHIISRNKEKLSKRMHKDDPESHLVLDSEAKGNTGITNGPSSAVTLVADRLKRDLLVSQRIDKICGIVFPVLFVIFNFIYWLVYCTGE